MNKTSTVVWKLCHFGFHGNLKVYLQAAGLSQAELLNHFCFLITFHFAEILPKFDFLSRLTFKTQFQPSEPKTMAQKLNKGSLPTTFAT